VRTHGAKGDGKTLDTAAIQRAIDAAASEGGGLVILPAGDYLSFSIRLRSHVGIRLDHGAILRAATPVKHPGAYDLPEPNPWDMYQDFGHSHWRNSLIWGENVEHVSITGPGRILGDGLTRRGPGPRREERPGDTPTTLKDAADASRAVDPEGKGARQKDEFESMNGEGNKAIALKLSRHVVLRDFTIINGGHFALLATGVDNLVIDNVTVETLRDGFDIDACRHVRISNCTLNTPNDDALVLKSSYGLGFARATENVTITNCHLSGFDPGTLLDGTRGRTQELAPDRDRVTGRIKFGTESNGGFRNITISNCTFERCRGIALETVDGGSLEDVNISDIVMREITTAPIFLRVGLRLRGPEGAKVSTMRRVRLSNITVYNADPNYASIIAGLPDSPVEDVELSNIRVVSAGGGTAEQAARVIPENERAYPEPSMFGVTPSHGFYIRNAKGLRMRDVHCSTLAPDARPAFVIEQSSDVVFSGVEGKRRPGEGADYVLHRVRDITVRERPGHEDRHVGEAERAEF
jgi:polygalacturonase